MIEAIQALAAPVQALVLRYPNGTLMCIGLAVLAWKLKRSLDKRTRYTVLEAWKHPDDLLLTLGAVAMFLIGAYKVLNP